MYKRRLFLDAAFLVALFSKTDTYHEQAKRLFPLMRQAREVWPTEAVLTEFGNAMSAVDRTAATRFVQSCYVAENIHPVPVHEELFQRGLALYAQRQDKAWGLTDCISFVVMHDTNLIDVLTLDHHFEQAGFILLMQP